MTVAEAGRGIEAIRQVLGDYPLERWFAAVGIPDTEEELNWHAFLAHSQDMQGFRADFFVGVPHGKDEKSEPFTLKALGLDVGELAGVWQDLVEQFGPEHEMMRLYGGRGGLQNLERDLAALEYDAPWHQAVLEQEGQSRPIIWRGVPRGHRYLGAIQNCGLRRWGRVLTALLVNSHKLREFDYSFRKYLKESCVAFFGDRPYVDAHFPSLDFVSPRGSRSLEEFLCNQIERDFHNVGPELAAYMICDWLLCLWREGKITFFNSFKRDARHMGFCREHGVPLEKEEFVSYLRGAGVDVPSRVVNEAIWLSFERGS